MPNASPEASPSSVHTFVSAIRGTAAVGSAEDRPWWGQCVRRLGVACADHTLGLLKETRDRQSVPNPGGLLTKMFKDVAAERGIGLR